MGHDITIIHPAYISGIKKESNYIFLRKTYTRYLTRKIFRSWLPNKWFVIPSEIKMSWVSFLNESAVPDGDIVVATHWHTAEHVASLPATKGKKFYLIQGLETWGGDEDRVYKTWKLSLNKIVISSWLLSIAKEMGENAFLLPNGLNFDKFFYEKPFSERDNFKLCMMFHELELKGSIDAFNAICEAKKYSPKISVLAFGNMSKPTFLPEYFEYHQSPSQEKLRWIYNECSIFLAPSHGEGWGLTASEAMMCGAVVIATDTVGHKDFIIDEVSGILCRPKDFFSMALKIGSIINDVDRKRELSRRAQIEIKKFDIGRSAIDLERYLMSNF